mmetsp:Transcript_41251/g.47905  ORF Transcript_41251/g.47905 Transcript_41251/m.47905 type:complete len:87 (-) Transcript_41251:283-543(-)
MANCLSIDIEESTVGEHPVGSKPVFPDHASGCATVEDSTVEEVRVALTDGAAKLCDATPPVNVATFSSIILLRTSDAMSRATELTS